MNLLKLNKGQKLLSLILSMMVMLAFTSCDDDDEVAPIVDDTVAYVSIYQASPNAPDLGITVDNKAINVYPFDYTEYTGYLRFFTGSRNLEIGPFDASNVVTDTSVTFENDNFYSVFIADNYSDLQVLVLNDNTEAPADGNAKVRFVHLSPDAPGVNLFANGEEDPLAENLAFKQSTDFMEVAEGEYDFEVQGSTSGEEQLSVPDIYLEDGFLYTVLVRGYASPPAGNENVLSADVILN